MSKIIAISGSLRAGSLNTSLLRAAADMFPDRIEVVTLHGIPLYDGDLEDREGVPTVVRELQGRISAADGLILSTPEYNNAMPGVLKNAMDWLTRPPEEVPRVWHGLPVAVTGATPGGFGTELAQASWLPVLRTLRVRPWFDGRLMVSRAHKALGREGVIEDDGLRSRVQDFVRGFIAFAEAARGEPTE